MRKRRFLDAKVCDETTSAFVIARNKKFENLLPTSTSFTNLNLPITIRSQSPFQSSARRINPVNIYFTVINDSQIAPRDTDV